MKHAVFFRNLNLGRPNCPTRAQFEAAFLAAGAGSAASFLTNGTLVFEARHKTAARKVLAQACEALAVECGLREPAFLRSVDHLAGLVALDPFAAVDRGCVYEVCVSFLHPKHIDPACTAADSEAPGRRSPRTPPRARPSASAAWSATRRAARTPFSKSCWVHRRARGPGTRSCGWSTSTRKLLRHNRHCHDPDPPHPVPDRNPRARRPGREAAHRARQLSADARMRSSPAATRRPAAIR